MRILSDEERADYTAAPGWRKYKGLCPTCGEADCTEDRELWKHYCLARLPEEHCRLEWDLFPMTDALPHIEQYIEHFRTAMTMGTGLTISAKQLGIGKTWVAVHIAQQLIKQGYTAYFVPFWELKNIFENPDVMESHRINTRLRESQLVILDDILKPYTKAMQPFYEDRVEEVLRFRSMSNLPTVVTSNLTEPELEEIYPRVYSLLRGKQVDIPLTATEDHRLKTIAVENDIRLASMRGEIRPLT